MYACSSLRAPLNPLSTRALLLSTRQLHADLAAGRTLFSAVRAGAADSYPSARADWQRERKFERRFADARAVGLASRRRRASVTLVRAQFDMAHDDDARAASQRVDAGTHDDLALSLAAAMTYQEVCVGECLGFAALREIDDHNAIVRNLAARGAFQPRVSGSCAWHVERDVTECLLLSYCVRGGDRQKRTDAVKFCVGDVVEVSEVGRGVVTGWTLARSHAFADLRVTYDVLPHSKHNQCVLQSLRARVLAETCFAHASVCV